MERPPGPLADRDKAILVSGSEAERRLFLPGLKGVKGDSEVAFQSFASFCRPKPLLPVNKVVPRRWPIAFWALWPVPPMSVFSSSISILGSAQLPTCQPPLRLLKES